MAILGSPPPLSDELNCDVVHTYRLLGCLMDDQLSFGPLLAEVVARSRASFTELYHAAETGRFSVPILAQQVCFRLEPGFAYVAPLLILAPRRVQELNKLQSWWARHMLGCQYARHIRWHCLRLQCGWALTLSSKVDLSAIMALARLRLVPSGHPGARLLTLVWDLPCPGWAAAVRLCMEDTSLAAPISDILSHPAFSTAEVTQARADSVARRVLLHRYRNAVFFLL